MFSVNRVTLIGFLGKDAEVRHARNNDTQFTVLSLATNRSWKDLFGTRQKLPYFARQK